MAVTDAYASAAEYRARTDKEDTTEDTELDGQLLGVSHFLAQRLRRFFTQDAAVVTRVYDGNGGARLWLPDDIATTTGLVVKADLDGDYDFADETALVLDTDFWVGPDNSALGDEARPYEWLDVHPTSSRLSAWPEQRRAVQVTAKFGWPAIPPAIRELTIGLTRVLRELQIAGPALTLQNIEAAVSLKPDIGFLLKDMERMYLKPTRF